MAHEGSDLAAPLARDIRTTGTGGTLAIHGGRIVTPTGTIEGGTVLIEDDRIERVRPGSTPTAEAILDARERVVIPGIVDLHGDDFEHQLVPRSDAHVDPGTALLATDRLNVAHGITTKLHAVAFEEDGNGHRSPERAREIVDTISDLPGLCGSNLAHARFERNAIDVSMVRDVLANDAVALASLVHHAPGAGEYADPDAFRERYSTDADLDRDRVETIAHERRGTNDGWDGPARHLVRIASELGVPLASHDDERVAAVEEAADRGVDLCEFPLTLEAIERANGLGLWTVMGAPNLVRGGSLFGNLATEAAIDRDVVDLLCADYHPPSLLQSCFVETGEPLHRRVHRVTTGPANALGMSDRGRIAAGARADLAIVDPKPMPRVADVIVAGRHVLAQ